MPEIVNIAGYKFVQLDQLASLKQNLLDTCQTLGIKGTVLLSHEGINLFLAAERAKIDDFLNGLRSDQRFADFYVKESISDYQPFNRLLVRLKKEIIAFGMQGIEPEQRTSPKLKPSELKQWLDEGRPVTLLDVRNDYEVELGTFKNAVVPHIDHFKQFPDAIEQLEALKVDQPIVMFCTGGIRCEKAGPFMEQAGFQSIYQLDGGILQYFEDVGGDHYDGDCFVFDQRVALDPQLNETDAEVCFACQAVLTPEHTASDQYVRGEHCPYCFNTESEWQQKLADQFKQRIKVATTPLPGSIPYNNFRPLNVPRRFHDQTVLEFLSSFHQHVPRETWLQKIEADQILYNGSCLKADDRVREGQRLEHLIPATTEPDVNPDVQLIYEDDFLVVVNKPAPLPMHPSGRFNRNSLIWMLDQIYDHQLRVAHRLDANTTGLVVFSRTRKVAALVQPQFEQRTVKKSYLVLVDGLVECASFQVDRPIADMPTLAGGRRIDPAGKQSLTQFNKLVELPERTLLEAIPLTGRTNQIRIHLWEQGLPIVGDPTYLPDHEMSETQTLSINDPAMCLHAWRLTLNHPETGQPITFEAPVPGWLQQYEVTKEMLTGQVTN